MSLAIQRGSLYRTKGRLGTSRCASVDAVPAFAGGTVPNDALRRALAEARLRDVDVASRIGVDPKTVRRWLDGRLPLLRHRWALADLVRRDEGDLWPDAPRSPWRNAASAEVLTTYPHHNAVPRHVWRQLFDRAEDRVGILAQSGMFLAEDIAIRRTLAAKARAGVRVRVLLSDPDDPAEENDEAIAAEIRDAIALYRPLSEDAGAEIRLHRTIPYASICHADDELLATPHLYGVSGAYAPVLHVRKASDAHMVANYLDAFEQVWERATPLD